MEKEGNYSENFPSQLDHHHHMLLNNPTDQISTPPPLSASNFYGSNSFDKLSFADVMQFADFGPKLALNQTKTTDDDNEDENGIDPVYFLKFPVLNGQQPPLGDINQAILLEDDEENQFLDENLEKSPVEEPNNNNNNNNKGKRKRPRSLKTTEEVESQRMTHIAVERNRRKQMNEHLRVLRSLMPSSYVQRGDQASIIGGAIEFVRELEQLLQCLESQKRRRIYGDAGPAARLAVGDPSTSTIFPPNVIPNDEQQQQAGGKNNIVVEYENAGVQEETGESKSCFADVEVKLLGFDALIKVLSRRRPGQLIKAVAALEDMHLNILHTNITTIEQTVLYSFNVKIGGEARFTAEDMANSVQQIFSFIHATTSSI